MRAKAATINSSERRFGLAILCFLVGGAASAAENETPDPTQIAPAPAAPAAPATAPVADPCSQIPQCRLDRFRAQLAHRRRQEYLERLSQAARAMDRRVDQATPWRTRYPFEVDAHIVSNLAYGMAIGYAPTWFMRVEGFIGAYPRNGHYGTDPNTGASLSSSVDGLTVGTQARVMPIKWALSPYLSLGWAYMGGNVSDYGNTFRGGGNEDAVAHFVTFGLGAELVLPYFHASLGYHFCYAFYEEALSYGTIDDQARAALKANFDNNEHGVSFQIGVVF